MNEADLDKRGAFDIIGLLSLCWQPQMSWVPTGQMLRPDHLILKEKTEKHEKKTRNGGKEWRRQKRKTELL